MALNKYIIERDIPEVGTLERQQLAEAAAKSNEVLAQLGPDIQWVESYVAADKTFCVYLAKDEDIIRKHAEISGFPATRVTAVRKMIDPDMDCRLGLRPRRHRQEAPRPGRLALHFVTDPLGDPLRENAHTSSTCGRRKQMQRFANNQPIEFIRFLTGH